MLFFSLVGAILALILINRSFETSFRSLLGRGNMALRYVALAVVGGSTLVLALPALRHILRFAALGADELLIVGVTITIILLLLEGCKVLQHLIQRDGREGHGQHRLRV
jgi:Ca2+-transporting ATPase